MHSRCSDYYSPTFDLFIKMLNSYGVDLMFISIVLSKGKPVCLLREIVLQRRRRRRHRHHCSMHITHQNRHRSCIPHFTSFILSPHSCELSLSHLFDCVSVMTVKKPFEMKYAGYFVYIYNLFPFTITIVL